MTATIEIGEDWVADQLAANRLDLAEILRALCARPAGHPGLDTEAIARATATSLAVWRSRGLGSANEAIALLRDAARIDPDPGSDPDPEPDPGPAAGGAA